MGQVMTASKPKPGGASARGRGTRTPNPRKHSKRLDDSPLTCSEIEAAKGGGDSETADRDQVIQKKRLVKTELETFSHN